MLMMTEPADCMANTAAAAAAAGCHGQQASLDGDFQLHSRLGSFSSTTAPGDEDHACDGEGTLRPQRAMHHQQQQHSLGSSSGGGSSFLRRLAGWQDDEDGAPVTAAVAHATAAAGGLCFRQGGLHEGANMTGAVSAEEEGSLAWFEQQVHEVCRLPGCH